MGSEAGRLLLVAAGFISVGVAMVGVVVPLLPTTPFLLLAAYLFWRGSPRWHAWLLENRVAGPHLRAYLEQRAVPRRTKMVALAVLWSSLGISAVVVERWYVLAVLVGIGVAVTVHIVRLTTLR